MHHVVKLGGTGSRSCRWSSFGKISWITGSSMPCGRTSRRQPGSNNPVKIQPCIFGQGIEEFHNKAIGSVTWPSPRAPAVVALGIKLRINQKSVKLAIIHFLTEEICTVR